MGIRCRECLCLRIGRCANLRGRRVDWIGRRVCRLLTSCYASISLSRDRRLGSRTCRCRASPRLICSLSTCCLGGKVRSHRRFRGWLVRKRRGWCFRLHLKRLVCSWVEVGTNWGGDQGDREASCWLAVGWIAWNCWRSWWSDFEWARNWRSALSWSKLQQLALFGVFPPKERRSCFRLFAICWCRSWKGRCSSKAERRRYRWALLEALELEPFLRLEILLFQLVKKTEVLSSLAYEIKKQVTR